MQCSCAEKQNPPNSAIDTALLEPFLDECKGPEIKGKLIAILQKAQEIYGYLPEEILKFISCKTGIRPAKIMSVVSFYTQFRTKPIGKNLILLCQGTACHVNGSKNIEKAIKESINAEEGDVSANGLFTYNNVACVGCCSLAPVIMIKGKTYGGLTPNKTKTILAEIEKGGAAE